MADEATEVASQQGPDLLDYIVLRDEVVVKDGICGIENDAVGEDLLVGGR